MIIQKESMKTSHERTSHFYYSLINRPIIGICVSFVLREREKVALSINLTLVNINTNPCFHVFHVWLDYWSVVGSMLMMIDDDGDLLCCILSLSLSLLISVLC